MRLPTLPSVPAFTYRNAKDTDVSLTFLEAYKRLWRAEAERKLLESQINLQLQRQQQ
mgnify:FL=1